MGTRDINICGDEGSPGNKEITICHERTNPEGREITVCGPDCSGTLPTLELTGADELTSTTDYEQYTASGGVEPYQFSFDGGSIDSTGKITSITSCGGSSGNGAMGRVTVSDACGQTKFIDVRLPGGSWEVVETINSHLFDIEYQCNKHYPAGEPTYINGGIKVLYVDVCIHSDAGTTCLNAANDAKIPDTCDCCTGSDVWAWTTKQTQQWTC